ncbi:MAG: hypothetical protein ACI9UK_001302, partial [Candidatus Krumholzibacteriia bacterium]
MNFDGKIIGWLTLCVVLCAGVAIAQDEAP